MDKFALKGIWKGEYVYDDKFQPSIIKSSIPFILKIKSIEDSGLFEGMCQDDPTTSKIEFPAEILGTINDTEIIFNKRYPKTFFMDNFGNLLQSDEPPPDIIYYGNISGKEKIYGTWKIERTFRKVNGKVMEFGPITGVWWMERA